MRTIDLNCDLGEGFGVYTISEDDQLLDIISSANIACGFHAGDPATMRRVVSQCLEKGVAIGAHPGLPDLHGFGRREMKISPLEAYDITLYQLGALEAFVRAAGGERLHHVKPHGALYNMAARDRRLADSIMQAIAAFDSQLLVYGLSGSLLIEAALAADLTAIEEAFVDRAYRADGLLLPRTEPQSVIHSEEAALQQGLMLAKEQRVSAVNGSMLQLNVRTLCVHGDGKHAAHLLQLLHAKLEAEGVTIQAPSHAM